VSEFYAITPSLFRKEGAPQSGCFDLDVVSAYTNPLQKARTYGLFRTPWHCTKQIRLVAKKQKLSLPTLHRQNTRLLRKAPSFLKRGRRGEHFSNLKNGEL